MDMCNLSGSLLRDHSVVLFQLCDHAYMKTKIKESPWYMLCENLHLANNLRKHADYLDHQNEVVMESHERKIKRTDEYEWEVYTPMKINAKLTSQYIQINKAIEESVAYTPLFLKDYTPSDARR